MLCFAVQSSLVGVTDIVLGRGDEEGLQVTSRLSVLIGYAQWPIHFTIARCDQPDWL